MAGHSHWKQIKLQKGSEDKKRSQLFSKLLAAITVAARTEPNPDFNPRLRGAIEKAREYSVPQNNIKKLKVQMINLNDLIRLSFPGKSISLFIFRKK